MKYDIIGDIHGCAKSLVLLLEKLGYLKQTGVYQKDGHQVIFLGDFIDRGPFQREVIGIVRPMIEQGYALSVMGNHEYNAIAYATVSDDWQDYLRSHSEKNDRQHQAFLDEYSFNSLDYLDTIEWFKTLPLWLEIDGIRIVHACWDQSLIDYIKSETGGQYLTNDFLHRSSNSSNKAYEAIEVILKGKEVALPEGESFKDKDGNKRTDIRIKWWDKTANTYELAYLGPPTEIPQIPLGDEQILGYDDKASPVFIGHYWFDAKNMDVCSTNVACVDYSVAKSGGTLTAYRYRGEDKLTKNNFVSIKSQESCG